MSFGDVSEGTVRGAVILESYTFPARAQIYDFTPDISHYAKGILCLTGQWVVGALTAGTAVLSLRLNGASVVYSVVQESTDVSTTASANTTGVPLAQGKDTSATYGPIDVTVEVLDIGTALNRSIWYDVKDQSAATTYPRLRRGRATISTPATGAAITSIGIACDTADGIGIGSWFKLEYIPT